MVSDKEQQEDNRGLGRKWILFILLGAVLGVWWERTRKKDNKWNGEIRPISELLYIDYIEDDGSKYL